MKRLRKSLLGLSAVAVAAAIGCGGGEATTSVDTTGATPRSAAAAAIEPAGPLAPDFELDAVSADGGALVGTKFVLSDRRGDVSLLYFSFVG